MNHQYIKQDGYVSRILQKIGDRQLRVVTYARCSTEKEVQVNAVLVQRKELRDECKRKNWFLVREYMENISGTTADRSDFQELMHSISKDDFDAVVIKDSDRLCRDVITWLKFIELLSENKKLLYISMKGDFYNPDSDSDDMMYGFKSYFDSYFSKKLSNTMRRSHKNRQINKIHPNITCEMYGWNRIDKNTFEINKEEKNYIIQAVDMFEHGKGFYIIAREMYKRGARSKMNGKIHNDKASGMEVMFSDMISPTEWRKIITSPRIYGTVIMNQYTKVFKKTKRSKNPENEWIYYENALPAIISRERYDNYMKDYQMRKNSRDALGINMKSSGKYALSGRIFCSECNKPFYRECHRQASGKSNIIWKCSDQKKKGKNVCDNTVVNEMVLVELIYDYYKDQFPCLKIYCESVIEDIIRDVYKVLKGTNKHKKIEINNFEIQKIKRDMDIAAKKLIEGVMSDETFLRFENISEKKIGELKLENDSISQEIAVDNDCEERIKKIECLLRTDNMITDGIKENIPEYIEKIVVYPDGRLNIEMKENMIEIFNVLNCEKISDVNKINRLMHFDVHYKKVTFYDKYRENIEQQVYELLKNNPEYKTADVAHELNKGMTSVKKVLARLKKQNKIEYIRISAKKGYWKVN